MSSIDTIAQAAQAAGFRGDALVTAIAVAGAESEYGANPGPSATGDYGDWQINHQSHPTYDTSQLLASPLYNAQAAYAISGGGTNWRPWTTYTSGAYTKYLTQARQAVATLGGTVATAIAYYFPLGSTPYTDTQDWSAGGHPGVDLSAPAGTPIYAAAAGKIVSIGGDPSGFGNDYPVEQLADGTRLTYGHASKSYVKAGQSVVAGQILAAVGSEGDSTGPHLHFQVNLPNGKTTDPLAWLKQNNASTDLTGFGKGVIAEGTISSGGIGGLLNPLNWPGAIAGAATDTAASAFGSLLGPIFFGLIKVGFVATGGLLVVLGLASTASKSTSMPSFIPIPV